MSDKEILYRYYRAKIRAIDPKNYTVDALISDASVDRHGTIIEPSGWKKDLKYYKEHPVLVASHDHFNLLSQMGESKKIWVTDEGLMSRFKYYVGEGNPEADWAWKLAEKGMAMYSVGFMPHDWEDLTPEEEKKQREKDPTKAAWRRYTRQELIEASQVVVGSNRNALQRTVGDFISHKEEKGPDREVADLATEILEKLGDEIPDFLYVPMSDEEFERPYPNYHSCRLKDPKDFQKGKFVTQKRKSDGKEYSVILGRLKGEKTLTEQGYRYHRNTWTEKEAKAHCKDHKGILFEPATGEEGKTVKEQPEIFTCECVECGHTLETEEHCKDIKCPECEGEMRRKERPGPGRNLDEETFKVVPFKKEGTAPEGRTWDAKAAIRRILIWAGGPEHTTINTEKAQCGFAFVTIRENTAFGETETVHHDVIDGTLVTVWKGCVATLVWLFSKAKDLSEAERKGIYDHIAGHYRENFDREPPEFKLFTNEEVADLFGLDEDGEDDSRETPPEPQSKSVYEGVLTDGPGEREGDDSGLESVIEEVGKLKANLKGGKGLKDLQALVRQVTGKEKEDD